MLALVQQVQMQELFTALYSPTAPTQNHPHKMLPHVNPRGLSQRYVHQHSGQRIARARQACTQPQLLSKCVLTASLRQPQVPGKAHACT